MRKNSLKAAGATALVAATVVTGLSFGPAALAAPAAERPTTTTPTASSSWVPSDGTHFKLVHEAADGRWWGQLVPGELVMTSYATRAEAEAHSATLSTTAVGNWFYARFTDGDLKGQCLGVIKSLADNVDILDYRGKFCGHDWTQFRMDSSGRMVSVDRKTSVAATPAHLSDGSWLKLDATGPAAHFANLNPALDPHPGHTDIVDRTAELSGVAKPDSTVTLRYGSTAAKDQHSAAEQRIEVGASGTWKTTLTGLSYGDNTVQVENWVGATQISAATATVSLPIAPVTAEAKVYTGESTEKVVVRGSGEPGTDVTIFNEKGEAVGGSKVGDYDGRYFASVTAPNAPGRHTFTVKQYVFDEEAGSATADFDYGAGVSITTPSNNVVTPGGPIDFSGKGEPRGEISITEQGSFKALGKGTVDARGEWKIEGVDLDGQKHDLVVTQVAKGNNTTTAKVVLNPDGSDTPPAPTGGVTLPNNVTEQALVNGRGVAPATGEPDTIITVKEGARTIGTGTVKASGNWLVRIDPLGPGVHTLTVTQTVNGHVSPPLVTTVDYGPALAVTGPVRDQAVAGRATFTGTGAAGSEIVVRAANRVPVCKVVMTTTGPWSCTDTNNILPMGKYDVLVEQVAKGSLLTTALGSLDHLPANYTAPTVVSPANGSTVSEALPTISGKATPNATIRVKTAAGTTIIDTRANSAGTWSKVPSTALTTGENKLTVTQIVNPGGHTDVVNYTITRTK